MKHINSLGHTYVLRLKKNLKVLHQGKKDKKKVWKSLSDLSKYKFHSAHYNEIELTENKYTTNIVINDSISTDTPWILATNGDYKRAIKDYSIGLVVLRLFLKIKNLTDFILRILLIVR